jgi:hypothetical protein
VIIVGNGLAGVWALAAHWQPILRRRAMWWLTGAAQVVVLAQAIVGVVLIQQGIEAPEFHVFYGFVAVASVGIIYSYRQQLEPHRYLLYGFGGLFLMGLGLRALYLG